MQKLKSYLLDGAGYQARGVLVCLQTKDIEESWSDEFKCYRAEIHVSRWENCREQGYVAMLRNPKFEQLNIAWFEHRNTDCICALKWLQDTINAPTIETAKFGDLYKDKYDLSHSVGYHRFGEMADWIHQQFTNHWLADTNN